MSVTVHGGASALPYTPPESSATNQTANTMSYSQILPLLERYLFEHSRPEKPPLSCNPQNLSGKIKKLSFLADGNVKIKFQTEALLAQKLTVPAVVIDAWIKDAQKEQLHSPPPVSSPTPPARPAASISPQSHARKSSRQIFDELFANKKIASLRSRNGHDSFPFKGILGIVMECIPGYDRVDLFIVPNPISPKRNPIFRFDIGTQQWRYLNEGPVDCLFTFEELEDIKHKKTTFDDLLQKKQQAAETLKNPSEYAPLYADILSDEDRLKSILNANMQLVTTFLFPWKFLDFADIRITKVSKPIDGAIYSIEMAVGEGMPSERQVYLVTTDRLWRFFTSYNLIDLLS